MLTFGKHKGKKLGDVPEDYIQWLSEKANDQWMRDAAKELLSRPLPGQEVIDIPEEDIPMDDAPF